VEPRAVARPERVASTIMKLVRKLWMGLPLMATACRASDDATPPAELSAPADDPTPMKPTPAADPASTSATPAVDPAPTSATPAAPTSATPAVDPAPPTVVSSPDDRPIPSGSGDYSAVLADARAYKRGEIDFAALKRRIVRRKLPPHPLGDGYVIMPVPAPPPGVPFDPMMMPDDWERTWGEVAMAHFAGTLSRDEYDRLHAAAHPKCKPSP
jgi:hypothetical protein